MTYFNAQGQGRVGWRSGGGITPSKLLDTYSGASAAYSLRKLRTAYTGSAIRVRRSSDNTTLDVGFNADGTLDTTSLLAFVGVGNGFVTIWYDQSGNGQHAVQTTASNQPYIVNAGVLYTLNNKPIIRNPEKNVIRCLITPTSSLQARPVSIIASGKIYELATNGFGNVSFYLGGQVLSGGGGRYEFYVDSGKFAMQRRNTTDTIEVINGANPLIPFIQQGHFGSTTLTNRFNGVDATTAITDTNQFTGASNFVLIGANSNQNNFMPNIGMYEYIFYFTDKVNDRVAIESNINSYYSIYVADTDAQTFITAAAITDATQQSAINTLVTQLKTYGIWNKMKAIYLFVGGTAAQHRFNLRDPRTVNAAFYLEFNGGWTHSSTGIQPNGTNAFAKTFLIPSSAMLASDFAHLSYYSNSNTQKAFEYVMGGGNSTGSLDLISRRNTNLQYFSSTNIGATYQTASNTSATTGAGFLLGTQLASTIKLFRSNVLQASNTTTSLGATPSPKQVYIGCVNDNDTAAIGFTDKICSFSSIGNGLTDVEAANFYNAVQAYQTTLGRAV